MGISAPDGELACTRADSLDVACHSLRRKARFRYTCTNTNPVLIANNQALATIINLKHCMKPCIIVQEVDGRYNDVLRLDHAPNLQTTGEWMKIYLEYWLSKTKIQFGN